MEFDLQRFDEQPAPENSAEEKPIPEELNGLGEEYAREALTEWEESKSAEEPKESAPVEENFSREDYQAKVKEVEELKAQLSQFQNQPQNLQLPQVKITPEISAKITEAIKAEAMNMAGFSEDDVASLDYADDDDPRLEQWQQAKNIAQNNVLGAIRQAQWEQQRQVQQFVANQTAAINDYNNFAQKESKEPDFKAIQNFATNEYFEGLTPAEQRIVAGSYLRVERQTASPAEMLVIKNYYEKAKAAYRGRGRKSSPKNSYQQKSAGLPRIDQLSGGAGKGEITVGELERMLETTDFDKIPEVYQNKLLGY